MVFKPKFRSWQEIFFPSRVSNIRKDDIIIPADIQVKARSAHEEVMVQQNTLTIALKSMFALADKQSTFMMWVKDNKARYVFANDLIRNTLLGGVKLNDIYNKTDNEIMDGKPISSEFLNSISGMSPENLPNIDKYLNKGTRICNLTDIITASFKKPCKFVENVDNLCLVVWKYPLRSGEKYYGTAGYGIDMSDQKDALMAKVFEKVERKEAWKINGTDNYYLTDFDFPKITVDGII
jgi:hypothetical protein